MPEAEWISVEERLPDDKQDYQLYCSNTGEQFVGFHHSDGRFQFGRYRDSVTDVQLLCTPTHWQPLPEPPK